ncbi:hypothetical protein OAK75_08525 [Bacteriovoracales bacterium]|nr:hypothetical protein [Bacteriovoracales bacterium]
MHIVQNSCDHKMIYNKAIKGLITTEYFGGVVGMDVVRTSLAAQLL